MMCLDEMTMGGGNVRREGKGGGEGKGYDRLKV